MSSKRSRVVALRGIRKASHLSRKAATKTARFLGRVEGKADRLIAGSGAQMATTNVDDFFYKKFPYLFPIHPALPNLGQRPSVTVFVPSLSSRGFYGGIATLLIASAALAKKMDYDYRVVQTSGFEKNGKVLEFLAKNDIHIKRERFSTLDISRRNPYRYAYLPLHPEDVIVVSAWWDAYNASKLPLSRKFVYMLQDYEPIFYNNGDEQQFAESTYHSNSFIPLCNTELMYKYFKNNEYKYISDNGIWFEPAVAVQNTKTNEHDKEKIIFLYGRPQVQRNMFYTAIQALDKALQSNKLSSVNWKIYCAGQSDIPNIKLRSGHVVNNLGKMDIDKYYEFTKSVDIALSPMLAPHPNYPTLELASVGAVVVTTRYKTKQSLKNYSSNILLCDPTVEDMTNKIVFAFDKSLSKQNARHNISSDWLAELDRPLLKVINKL